MAFDPRKKRGLIANRRRNGYELTSQRDMLPIALGAATAAILVHAAIFWAAPDLLHFNFVTYDEERRVEDEIVRVVVKERPEEEYVEAEEQEVPQEIEQREEIEQENVEIDILDYEPEELTMAPGETDLAIPEPVQSSQDATPAMTMTPAELNMELIGDAEVPAEALQVAEPTPVNANSVVVNTQAQLKDLEEANSLMESELREGAKAGDGQLPADTRSLAELIGMDNPGAKSGVARLGTDLLFGFNQCRLTNSARISMLQLAALIQKNPETDFVIEGHTDSIGSADYNALLSLQRAAAVREWLEKNMVPTQHVYIRACGNHNPLVSNTGTRDQQSLNRRVEIHMRRKGEGLPAGCFPAEYKVDLQTSVSAQIASGIRVPETYKASSTRVSRDAADKTSSASKTATKKHSNRTSVTQRAKKAVSRKVKGNGKKK